MDHRPNRPSIRAGTALLALLLLASACKTSSDTATDSEGEIETATSEESGVSLESKQIEADDPVASSTFTIEIWADNWMAVYVNGELIGEDSVSITTERSFNVETFTFEASYPFTLGIEAKDFKETDSGIEYIWRSESEDAGSACLLAPSVRVT